MIWGIITSEQGESSGVSTAQDTVNIGRGGAVHAWDVKRCFPGQVGID